jgi:hypothetical protein
MRAIDVWRLSSTVTSGLFRLIVASPGPTPAGRYGSSPTLRSPYDIEQRLTQRSILDEKWR